ncbi:MAG: reverse transcriptase domain-containing protein [Caldilineaceae bacterium]
MPTQVTGAYADVYEWENLYLSYRKAAKGKRSRRAAAFFEFKLEDNLINLHDELAAETYTPGQYTHFTIHEPKKRLISAAPFRDRVVHHALCRVIEPAFERSFIDHSYANRVGKGTHRALDTCQQWLKRYRYVLQCDVKQFFPSIDHIILQRTLNRRIQDGGLRRLIARILQSGVGVLREEYDMVYFPGDVLLAVNRPRGLPIGNLTSQFWANCYMNSFDHFVTRELGCPAYLRYVDDFLLFGDDKAQLQQWRSAVIARLAQLRLTLHETKAQVRPTSEGVGFLGFFLYPTHRRLRSCKGIAFQRKLAMLMRDYRRNKTQKASIRATLLGWINHVRYGDTWGLRRTILQEVRL